MGWVSGDLYETVPSRDLQRYGDDKTERKRSGKQLRMHKLAMDGDPKEAEIFAHYDALPDEEKGKGLQAVQQHAEAHQKIDGSDLSADS